MKTGEKVVLILLLGGCGGLVFFLSQRQDSSSADSPSPPSDIAYEPRLDIETSGMTVALGFLPRWSDPTSFEQIRDAVTDVGHRNIDRLWKRMSRPDITEEQRLNGLVTVALLHLYEGEAKKAYEVLQEARALATASRPLAGKWLYTLMFAQGVASLRRGEDENCVECRGEGACIFPLRPTALHSNPEGSRQAIRHFTEYLARFPQDFGVRWLLNLAYMTLGEHPRQVPRQFLLPIDHFGHEADIGRFPDIADRLGLNRFTQAGGAIMDDFDNDGLLDIVVTSWDPAQAMAFYRNKGDGTFEDRTEAAGLSRQLGGLNLVQTDFNNDGYLDIFICRGAWFPYPMRPTLLRNNGNGTFTDVTREAGLMDPVNCNCAAWGDFDSDGFLDVYICNETGPNRLYRNRGDGTFEEVAVRAGVQGTDKRCKGATWIDYDNDGYPDLFVNYLDATPQLFHNNRDGTFTDVSAAMGIDGPRVGFACWAFDYDNDGFLDIFATSFDRDLDDLVRDLFGQPISKEREVTRLWRNLGGKKFQDVSSATGVGRMFSTMGCNFADFDNDGYLDFYLGTGEPAISTLVPNRMFKNVAANPSQAGGRRFVDITATSGTGILQKGHGVACGDWNRDGNIDVFTVIGGATPGDRFRSALFQNPGQGNNWLTVKLIGKKTNRAAIGARIKVVPQPAAGVPAAVHRLVSTGSSFGANPLQQTIGIGKATSVATLEIFWPTSQTTQVFHDVAVNQAIEVTEFDKDYRQLHWTRVPAAK